MSKATAHLSLGLVAVVGVLAVGSAVAARPQPPVQPGVPSILIPLRATPSASQVPGLQVASTATGRFIGALVRNGFGVKGQRPNLSWTFVWALAVQNTTGPVTGVEIRSGAVATSAASGSPFLKLCGPCTGTNAASLGVPGATVLGGKIPNLTSEQVASLRRDELWLNVLTAANPSGELRGQITRQKPVTTNAPPNTRMPNPLKPVPSQQPSPPIVKIPGPSD